MEITKAAQTVGLLADHFKEPLGVGITGGLGHAQNLGHIGVTDEMRIERLTVAGDPVKGIQVGFQKI